MMPQFKVEECFEVIFKRGMQILNDAIELVCVAAWADRHILSTDDTPG